MRTFAIMLIFASAASARAQHVAAPTNEVRAALAQLQPDVIRCTTQHAPAAPARARRYRVRVWLYPTGAWTMDVPELADQSVPSNAALSNCLHTAVATRIAPHLRAFAGRTRIKVERAYSVRPPGPPPASSALSALIARRRAQLIACVPGSGTGDRADLIVRSTLETDGRFRVVGVGAPEGAPFDAIAACVEREVANVRHDPVTAPATFETTIRLRYRAPAPAAI